MKYLSEFITVLNPVLPLLGVLLGGAFLLWAAHWVLFRRHKDLDKDRRFPRQLIMLALTVGFVASILLVLPVGDAIRNQLVGLLGILVSAIVALSSTTLVANLMSGIILRVTKPFEIGDFIRVGDHFGRVSERGLFDTEIQSESREFIALPNTYLIRNPVTTIHRSGTVVSISVSLGYDTHHAVLEPILVQAAEESGLEEPFVHILELGNYAVTYRIAGFLPEVKGLITARSNLCKAVLDMLHQHQVEIVSPSFMNQRPLDPGRRVMPEVIQEAPAQAVRPAEEIVFDKAEQAEQYEERKQALMHGIEEMEASLKNVPRKDAAELKSRIEQSREQLRLLEQAREESNRQESGGMSGADAGQ